MMSESAWTTPSAYSTSTMRCWQLCLSPIFALLSMASYF